MFTLSAAVIGPKSCGVLSASCVVTCLACHQGSWGTPNCLGNAYPRRPSGTAASATSDTYLQHRAFWVSFCCMTAYTIRARFWVCVCRLTALDGDWNLHGSASSVAHVGGRERVPVSREVAKLIPELHNALLSCPGPKAIHLKSTVPLQRVLAELWFSRRLWA